MITSVRAAFRSFIAMKQKILRHTNNNYDFLLSHHSRTCTHTHIYIHIHTHIYMYKKIYMQIFVPNMYDRSHFVLLFAAHTHKHTHERCAFGLYEYLFNFQIYKVF